jgi:hypothetical protein
MITSRKVVSSIPYKVTDFFSIYLIFPAPGVDSGIFLGGKARLALKANNLTALCEPTV